MAILFPHLTEKISQLAFEKIDTERIEALQPLIHFIQKKLSQDKTANLHFICTHNSRRSQLAQVWAQMMADHFGLKIKCFSGGSETTEFHQNVVDTLVRVGFEIQKVDSQISVNPQYHVFYSKDINPILVFSKLISNPINPQSDFAAVMTCSQADENCPIVVGAENRIALRYDDPKLYDGTPLEAEKYEERSHQIASELFYVCNQLIHLK